MSVKNKSRSLFLFREALFAILFGEKKQIVLGKESAYLLSAERIS